MTRKQDTRPAPTETGTGRQNDDNIDDLGHRQDGTEEDQPVDPGKADKAGKDTPRKPR